MRSVYPSVFEPVPLGGRGIFRWGVDMEFIIIFILAIFIFMVLE